MDISQNVESYGQIDKYIRNILTRNRFLEILRDLHFANNQLDDKTDRGFTTQSIDEHMTKFKGKHSARQYSKKKPINWDFKWWCRADSNNIVS